MHSNVFIYGSHTVKDHSDSERGRKEMFYLMKEGNVLCNEGRKERFYLMEGRNERVYLMVGRRGFI